MHRQTILKSKCDSTRPARIIRYINHTRNVKRYISNKYKKKRESESPAKCTKILAASLGCLMLLLVLLCSVLRYSVLLYFRFAPENTMVEKVWETELPCQTDKSSNQQQDEEEEEKNLCVSYWKIFYCLFRS